MQLHSAALLVCIVVNGFPVRALYACARMGPVIENYPQLYTHYNHSMCITGSYQRC
jgi:hypothetical protein